MKGAFLKGIGAALVLATAWMVFPAVPAHSQQMNQQRWMEQAEETFGLGRGLGRQLMTREEWRDHQRKMQQLSPEERQSYRNEWHRKLQERAREKGLSMPAGPGMGRGPEGGMMGPGSGMGGRGMGGGRGGR